jgi:aspartate-semialdehyde dehydrogenase
VFDRQLAFNLLSCLGSEAPAQLMDIEVIVSQQLRMLLGTGPMPAITLLQAPIFHSHAYSIFVEMDTPFSIGEFENLLECDELEVIRGEEEPPSPVQVTGTNKIQIGGIKRDLSNPKGFWALAVSDNLRLSALNAVTAAEKIILS